MNLIYRKRIMYIGYRWLFYFLLLNGLLACGTPEHPQHISQDPQSLAITSNTPTVNAAMMEKTTIAQQDLVEEQTALALPSIIPMTPTDGPVWVGVPPTPNVEGRVTPIPEAGYLLDTFSFSSSAYKMRNAWQYHLPNGDTITVFAGKQITAAIETPAQGVIVIQRSLWSDTI